MLNYELIFKVQKNCISSPSDSVSPWSDKRDAIRDFVSSRRNLTRRFSEITSATRDITDATSEITSLDYQGWEAFPTQNGPGMLNYEF